MDFMFLSIPHSFQFKGNISEPFRAAAVTATHKTVNGLKPLCVTALEPNKTTRKMHWKMCLYRRIKNKVNPCTYLEMHANWDVWLHSFGTMKGLASCSWDITHVMTSCKHTSNTQSTGDNLPFEAALCNFHLSGVDAYPHSWE